MKYMGSKRSLLDGQLGSLLIAEAAKADRFVDLFAGTARVAWHVAEQVSIPVLAVDLQQYSSVLAESIVGRSKGLATEDIVESWLRPAQRTLRRTKTFRSWSASDLDRSTVLQARETCSTIAGGAIWDAYGGHYFSPSQAATFDHLLAKIPDSEPEIVAVCTAALVLAASKCAAAPGHTAQPFQPTETALPYIVASWLKDPISAVEEAVRDLAPRHAKVKGKSQVANANDVAESLGQGDLVFLDPPYSSVHYSRFYHVLETVARGSCGPVEGVGRYPPAVERPSSAYSIKTQAGFALLDLLKRLAGNGCSVVLTFPQGNTSNGLNGEELAATARDWFRVDACVVASRFSTLGGNGENRSARRRSGELVLTMEPV